MRPSRSSQPLYRSTKRALDLAAASLALLLLVPLLGLIAFLIRLKMGPPVLFRQTRGGEQGRPFTYLKFRTMTNDQGPDGELLPDEDRLTRLGRFLRSTTLDELPSLWNVVKGDLSIVGPRPLYQRYVDRYDDEQRRRLEVKPGLTSWAVIKGRNALSWDERFALDVWYVDNRSFFLDLRIILLTILMILKREGVSQEGHATMPEFTGSSTSRNREADSQ